MTTVNTQGFGIQLAPAGFSLEANKIFESYEAALTFVRTKPAAYVGSVITVKAPSTIDGVTYPAGVYNVTAVGENGALEQVGKDTDLSGYYKKTEVDEIADGLATAVGNKAEKTAVQNVLAKNEAAAIDVRLYYRELQVMSQHAFEVEYEIYSESQSSLIVSMTQVLDSNGNVIATTTDGELVSIAEATYTASLSGRHDFTFRVTLESGLVHDHKFSINYYGRGFRFGHSSGSSEDFNIIGTEHLIMKEGAHVSYFVGEIDLSKMPTGKRLSLDLPPEVTFHCLKSNGFVIPMIEMESNFYCSDPMDTDMIENMELVYSFIV